MHTNHRALLMRLITPKRLKENEDAMWQIADDMLDTFLAGGEGEFIKGFASPFTLLVIADLLGVPEEDRGELIERLARAHTAAAWAMRTRIWTRRHWSSSTTHSPPM